jgi:ABC-type glutathione transport system ATPase component
VDALEADVNKLRHEDVTLERVAALFRQLLQNCALSYAEGVSGMVTEGLKAVFHDQELEFRVLLEERHGKVHAVFKTRNLAQEVEGGAMDSFGGGVAAVQSLLLRVLILLKSGKAPYLFLDESLAALSEEYVHACGTFLARLCKDLGVNVLLVTHNRAFVEESDRAYQAQPSDGGGVVFRRLKAPSPQQA